MYNTTLDKKPRLVIFDMDGLMFDSERTSFEGLAEILLENDYVLEEREYLTLIGLSNADFFHFFANSIPGCDPEELDRRSIARIRELFIARGIPIKPGLFELLDWLDANGIKKVVATSTSTVAATEMLKKSGVYERFDGFMFGDNVEHSKPEPDIFLLSAELGGAAPADALVLEDSVNGIKAANAAGIPVIMVPDMIPMRDELAPRVTATLNSLHEVISLLERLP